MRALARQIGVHRLTVFQSWRVVGTLAFFSYGAKNVLPPLFVREAAWGDLITALAAASLAILPRTRFGYAAVNVIGALDFLVAVSLGVALTLMHDARMATNATFPIALIPLFGVGVSFAVHLIAFDVLRDTQPESQRVEPTLLRSSEGRA
jgi:hypothetical protein